MKFSRSRIIMLLPLLISTQAFSDDDLKLQTTIIKGNNEAPQIIYMVPWQEAANKEKLKEQKLVLHSLFGGLFDPILPEMIGPLVGKSPGSRQ